MLLILLLNILIFSFNFYYDFYAIWIKTLSADCMSNDLFTICIEMRKNNEAHARILIPHYSLLERKPLYSTSGR